MPSPTKRNEHWHMLTAVVAERDEIDHLEGLLFLDRVVSPRHDLFRRKTYR